MSTSSSALLSPTISTLQLKIILTDVLCEALFFGVQGAVTILGIYILCFKSDGLRTSFGIKLLVGIILLLLCLSACSLSLTIWTYMAKFSQLGGTFDAAGINNKTAIITMVLQRLAYFISDSIVVWRAWLLWNRNIFVKLLLVICLLGTITATFIEGALTVTDIIPESGPSTLMFTLPLLITNLCATIFMGLRIWEYRGSMSELSGSRMNKMLLIFLESSALYCVFWVLAILGTLGNVASPIATAAIMGSLPYITSIYPVVVVVLVTLEKNDYGSSIPIFHTPGGTDLSRTGTTVSEQAPTKSIPPF